MLKVAARSVQRWWGWISALQMKKASNRCRIPLLLKRQPEKAPSLLHRKLEIDPCMILPLHPYCNVMESWNITASRIRRESKETAETSNLSVLCPASVMIGSLPMRHLQLVDLKSYTRDKPFAVVPAVTAIDLPWYLCS